MPEGESKFEENIPTRSPDKKEPKLEKEISSDDTLAKEKPAEKEGGLYFIKEIESGFEVNLPGLIDKEKGWIVGTSREIFQTKEEAEQRAEQARESVRIQREKIPLEKAFAGTLCSISETRNGKFRVATPESHDTGMGYNWVGVANKEFGSWDEARDYLLAQQEQQEKLTEKPTVYEIQSKMEDYKPATLANVENIIESLTTEQRASLANELASFIKRSKDFISGRNFPEGYEEFLSHIPDFQDGNVVVTSGGRLRMMDTNTYIDLNSRENQKDLFLSDIECFETMLRKIKKSIKK